MLLCAGLVLLFLGCVRTTDTVYDDGFEDGIGYFGSRFSLRPTVFNGAHMMHLRKREAGEPPGIAIPSEGEGSNGVKIDLPTIKPAALPLDVIPHPSTVEKKLEEANDRQDTSQKQEPPKIPEKEIKPLAINSTTVEKVTNLNTTSTTTKESATKESPTKESPTQLNINNPGVIKRGLIVFGGFLLLAISYFIFYRRKSNKNEATNAHNNTDANQFRYGVLESDDRRDNLELSRIPLTMESDEEEDDDLEIFDLEQKKKSLSYINLQTNDEDLVFSNSSSSKQTDKDNLLLDIEDPSTDTLINWSNNGNKSIL